MSDLFTVDGTDIVIGRDYALQNEIDEVKAKTKSRSCFKECRTCGACANSKRDNTWQYSYDKGKKINCKSCEKFRYHDCHNGVLRNTRQEAEPFTEDMYKIMDEKGGKPLI